MMTLISLFESWASRAACGGPRCNRAALRAAIALVPEGATLEVFELHDIPGFNQDDEGNPPSRVINEPEMVIGNAAARFDAEGNLKDEATAGLIRDLLRNLVALTRQLGQRNDRDS